MEIKIRELVTKDEMMQAYSLVNQMYDKITREEFSLSLDEMISRSDYKIVAAFDGEKLMGISGYWIARMLYCGRYLQASNLVVDKEARKSGVGKKLLNYLEEKARHEGCNKFVLDSYVLNTRSHTLFFREGFYIRGFHFMKDLS